MVLCMDKTLTERVPLLLSSDQLAELDAWRREQPKIPSRGEAIRQLMMDGMRRAWLANHNTKDPAQ